MNFSPTVSNAPFVKMRALIFYLLVILGALVSARCPESKKAHSTSCTLFYNCVALPSGGYVWVPSKCADGLVFQPYLQLCVLPGDRWNCESSKETQPSNREDASNYVDSTPNTLDFSDLVDHPLATGEISEGPNDEAPTPQSLIEIEESTELENETKDPSQESSCTHSTNNSQTIGTHSLLSKLINHLLVYKGVTIPLESLTLSSTSAGLQPSTLPIDLMKNTRHNVLANYLIQNYIQQNNLQTTVITGVNTENTTTADSINDLQLSINSDNTGLIINTGDSETNIVLITDSFGNKQYITIEKYQSHSQYSNWKSAILLPCVRNIRLANATDCIKYYTCDPSTAIVADYTCPQNTAFNKYSRVCDTETRVLCTNASTENAGQSGGTNGKPNIGENCGELGKIKDPSSDIHYFICYAPSVSSTQIKSIRLACPNGLIFCQNKKFCTTRRLCAS